MASSNKKYKVITKSGVIVQLTKAQKRYADEKIANPDKPLVASARVAYPNQNEDTLRQQVQANEKNLDITIYSDEQSSKAALTVVELMDSNKEDVRFKAATDILDRTHGKSIQRQQTQNTNLNLNLEVSKELGDNFTEFLKSKTAI